MHRPTSRLRTAAFAAALGGGLLALAALTTPPAWPDDRELLRENIAKPYVFLLLDTSASMNLKIGTNEATDLYGDDPDSRLYAAKEALFKVFSDVENVHFGFAVFNQDRARVIGKHWAYYVEEGISESDWPLDWPVPDLDGLSSPNPSDPTTPIKHFDSAVDVQVFGSPLVDLAGNPLTAGDCFNPLDLNVPAERRMINYFAKLGADGSQPTDLWVTWMGVDYQVQMRRDSTSAVEPGEDNLPVQFFLGQINACNSPNSAQLVLGSNRQINRVMRLDPRINEFLMIDGAQAGGTGTAGSAGPAVAAAGGTGSNSSVYPENVPGYWNYADGRTDNDCAAAGPHTGGGWESNYDSGDTVGDPRIDTLVTDEDKFCSNPLDADTCVEIRPFMHTVASSYGRPLDRGDVLPLDWQNDNRDELLRRLAPNYPIGVPDFRVSPHLKDSPDPVSGLLEPRIPGRPPIMASGITPLGEAILDYRCWYASENSNKCGQISNAPVFFDGWEETACKYDTLFGCRRPYLIVISDGENTCEGNSPTSEVASLRSKTGAQTWALAVGNTDCNDTELKFAEGAGSGECINVTSKAQLLTELQNILGTVTAEARTFASAAVPTVQSNATETLLLSDFRPIADNGFWDGHLRNFQKPLPLDADGKPDINDVVCNDADGCVLWDAAKVLATLQSNDAAPLALDDGDKRRVFYGRRSASGSWPVGRRLLESPGADPTVFPGNEEHYDLWRGLGLIAASVPDGSFSDASETAFEAQADGIVSQALALKSGKLGDGTLVNNYLLGDIFHSQPLIVEAPPNNFFFAQNVGAELNPLNATCKADDTTSGADRGYRCFVERQLYRRKLLLVGANDGMLHAFDAGQFSRTTKRFGTGTGREVWAYMPRPAMSTVRQVLATDRHQFSVDGSPAVGDVFIDPVFAPPATAPVPTERIWRTVVVTGLREGGSGYFALDITAPEPLEAVTDLGLAPKAADPAVAGCTGGVDGCGPNKYPAPLWEFYDTTADSFVSLPPSVPLPLDEDGNGAPDLGDTWSTANFGRIRVCDGAECDPTEPLNDVRDVYVAVFGGGMDPDNKGYDPRDGGSVPPIRGNWVYMVDVETGKTIYKRQLDGPAPADPAAVDTDQDGYLDRIYLGTIFGSLYRIDLVADADGDYPKLSTATVSDLEGTDYDADRIVEDKNGDPIWSPVKIFDTNFNNTTATDVPRAIYQAPSVFFVTKLGLYGLAFGTGDREDITAVTPEGNDFQTGRFYVFVDDTGLDPGPTLPLKESNFTRILFSDVSARSDLITSGPLGGKGWVLLLRDKEKVVSQAFSLLGVTFFSTFVAEAGRSDGRPTTCPADPKDVKDEITCSPTGTSNLFVTATLNAQPFLREGTTPRRYRDISGAFVSNPFTEIGITEAGSDATGSGPGEDLTDAEKEVMEAIKALFPPNCRFTSQRVDVKLVTSKTKVERIAAVPVCVIEKNWKEF